MFEPRYRDKILSLLWKKPNDPILVRFARGARLLKGKIKKIYLFGSRARGTEKPYSDYDLLLVVSNPFTLEDKSKLYDVVVDILADTGDVVSLKIFKQKAFDHLRGIPTPFMKNVMREGIQIG